ncbi:TonB-dependent receptor family protein [Tenacibaculum sp. IB213877]|uniref:TonB-dependent receptor family protein n=1 Tax=Tenacibaculum sp. IB213877 TaxID=3097351 RepID=UPI002A5A3D5F|nr:TonB-dependent receptor [Tenacibaculum sp. IB213877]MDY0779699.1 TonB-dependent receptor [Tenacibaculum sp. IB213877]
MKLKLKDYSFFIFLLMISSSIFAQTKISGTVTSQDKKMLQKVQIFDASGNTLATTNSKGYYEFETKKKKFSVVFFLDEYELNEVIISTDAKTQYNIVLNPFSEELTEVEIKAQKRKVFELKRLKDVEQTAIYAGKKTEVVLVSQSTAALASNNARQIYNQVAGLNIFENDDAGLQLNIGGRGLDPNRTSNFNTRQNGYDISADVLGYPESYYTPQAEGLEEIQVVRGAASLQYGTQFGGLINFVMKKPNPNKPLEIITRSTLGSNNLYTNFTSLGGTSNKVSYYGYYNYKQGNGFRPNSEFNSKNVFTHVGYEINDKSKVEAEITYLNYLAQQAGGLTDTMFKENPFQSNRTRNWFKVDWLLYNLKFSHNFSEDTKFTFNFFGLNASRKAVGFRDRRIDIVDDPNQPRELLVSDFKNFGFEARFLDKYTIFNKDATYLFGVKYYNANNKSVQGPGSATSLADFELASDEFPNYINQSDFSNPNQNIAVFGENIFYVSDKLSITPGFRFEYIKTGSDGYKRRTNLDGAGNPIGFDEEFDNITKERSFVLLGLGLSYKPSDNLEMYTNISQNYRSITFSDVNIVNPSNAVDPNLEDEKGFTADLGFRGDVNNYISYDVSAFALFYNNRIGDFNTTIPPVNNVGLLRTNIGKARILGIESLVDVNLKKVFDFSNDYSLNVFVNSSFTNSEYTESKRAGIKGNKVEFVPDVNVKTGVRAGYENFLASVQYSYLSEQFNDADNTPIEDLSNAVRGKIPAYDILDVSLSYKYKYFKLETGINNLLDNHYFTRRATGYPGPGIIPSAPRNWYATLQLKI